MPILTADDDAPTLLMRLATPAIPPALSLAAMIGGPVQAFAIATGSLAFTPILAAAICFHFARQFSARERGWKRASLFVGWLLASAIVGSVIIWAALALTPLTPKPGWLETK